MDKVKHVTGDIKSDLSTKFTVLILNPLLFFCKILFMFAKKHAYMKCNLKRDQRGQSHSV